MNKKEIIKEYQKQIASLGGIARATKLSPERRKQIAIIAIKKRWENR